MLGWPVNTKKKLVLIGFCIAEIDNHEIHFFVDSGKDVLMAPGIGMEKLWYCRGHLVSRDSKKTKKELAIS